MTGAAIVRDRRVLTDPASLLAAWEAARGLPPPMRPLALVQLPATGGDPADTRDAALDLTLGDVARLAARAHVETFGSRVEVTVTCSACGVVLELELSLDELAADDDRDHEAGWLPVADQDGDLVARLPTMRDLLAVRDRPDPEAGLLERCVRNTDGTEIEYGNLTAAQLAAVDTNLQERSGSAGVVLRTDCPGCADPVVSALDTGALLWQQVEVAAPALLAEVVALAAAFGWSEDAVLGLSTARRRAYLALLDAS